MQLRTLPSSLDLQGKRVLVRLDWNVPLVGSFAPEDTVKIERSLGIVHALQKRGAIVVVLTHLGRPEGRDPALSTKRLLGVLAHRFRMKVVFHPQIVSSTSERKVLLHALVEAEPGSVHLLENVRFEKGEEKNEAKLAKAYAELGELFVNDAFASSHRAHATIVGITKLLPSYAGPELVNEVTHLETFLTQVKKPFIAVIGGLKLSTKIPIIKALLPLCDEMLIGGAMANTMLAALKCPTGASFVETKMLKVAKSIAEHPKVLLPLDVVVTKKKVARPVLVSRAIDAVAPDEHIVDIGLKTLRVWGQELLHAKTILWNGPMGIIEIPACGAGSRFIARAIARRANGRSFAVAGGGETLSVVFETRTASSFDHVSMGGGALLEFLTLKGKLPGIIPLLK
ncbi:MAG: phosphoglycerate kinase [Patescibacteria group bacterium]